MELEILLSARKPSTFILPESNQMFCAAHDDPHLPYLQATMPGPEERNKELVPLSSFGSWSKG